MLSASLPRGAGKTVALLALLYAAQGIPFGIAVEVLPVLLREKQVTQFTLALVGLLQIPWYAKVLWAPIVDRPLFQLRARGLLLTLQVLLAGTVLGYAIFPFHEARTLWFVLTGVAALVAATQDLFVDALAVRTLSAEGRGAGNVAQVAGYRLGMLAGGGGLLWASSRLGDMLPIALLSLFILVASGASFAVRDGFTPAEAEDLLEEARADKGPHVPLKALLPEVLRAGQRLPIIVAIAYKFGLHLASGLLKPMVVDAGWKRDQIGFAVVTVGTVASLLGAGLGGLMHRLFREEQALKLGAILQTLACIPLFFLERAHAPLGPTTLAFALEHGASAAGTTILFAALMTATRKDAAGGHYTLLVSGNALGIGVAGLLGGLAADHVGRGPVFVVAALGAAVPIVLLGGWSEEARRSAGTAAVPGGRAAEAVASTDDPR